tara:strand:+ start:1357 stop:1641 length:285 start_codon:yes stop_codon:yes gene_type:complete
MSEGALEYKLIEETKVNIKVSDIIDRLASIVDNRLEEFWLYDEEPYLSNNDNGDSVEVYLVADSVQQGSPCDWKILFDKAIEKLAKEILEEESE